MGGGQILGLLTPEAAAAFAALGVPVLDVSGALASLVIVFPATSCRVPNACMTCLLAIRTSRLCCTAAHAPRIAGCL